MRIQNVQSLIAKYDQVEKQKYLSAGGHFTKNVY